MSQLQEWEKAGLRDFFTFDVRTEAIAIDMAKFFLSRVSITSPKTSADAIEKILHYCESIQIILDKKAVTKDILITYLMQRGATFSPNSTKQALIQRIIRFWQDKPVSSGIVQVTEISPSPTQPEKVAAVAVEDFPVNILSRQFASWFFRKLNETTLALDDLWPDASCAIRLVQNDMVSDENAHGSEAVLEKLITTRNNYNFTFNPNINHSGVQGRINPHGLVFVVCCGTLHVTNRWVGIFESAFGLVQDPSTGPNNWKCKQVKIELRSTQQQSLPTLQECQSIKNIIELPLENHILPE
uniref:Uncharacterized protein n=1 Tax=Phlebotomus papatasi TaxID=29031 RepID=A0A1B0DQT1_PHLPP